MKIKVKSNCVTLMEDYPIPKKLYSIKDNKAYWDSDAQDYIWWDSEARFNDKYAKCYKAEISPKGFLDLTTSKGTNNLKLGDDLGGTPLKSLDISELDREIYQPLFLMIDFSNFEWDQISLQDNKNGIYRADVVGHEGRHRAFALWQAGIDKIDVQLRVVGGDEGDFYDKYMPFEIKTLYLYGQFNKNRIIKIDDPIVMSWERHKQINPNLK